MTKAHDILERELSSVPAQGKHRNDLPVVAVGRRSADNRLWYCTTDPVNLAHVEQLARPFGLTVKHHEPRDGAVPGHAILIDADFWWPSLAEIQRGVENLLTQDDDRILAVHSWHLTDEQIARLIDAGIHADNRLDHNLIALIVSDLATLPPYNPVPITV